ncbi:cytochrome c oxidase subunit II [Rossellomorea aquimaris]|uniref:cytochrome c oxidase subunit II n=1 Tax=Rossellomorea aquimaris TaxID=189382 RepID=UPI001CD7A3AC|nr:cytochrome c oxidase subunit II [Rossellomorea aquimaris]MCA1053377.1 cytochrome c oxidase subunit II [Rossellomorea aquimaris]
MKARLTKWRLFSIVALMALILSGCGEPFLSTLQPAGEVAQTQYDLMILATSIMVLVIIVVMVVYAVAVIRFRRKKGDTSIPKQVEGSHTLEIVWTVIPIILLLILAVPTVTATFQLADTKAMDKKDAEGNREALVVNVRANLYWWEFEYPDQKIITSQDLVVPTDQKVYFNVTASDVKHSFWIPAAGGKIDTNVDGVNTFFLEFDDEKSKEAGGVFYGKCAELCGPSHALMDFKVKALSQDDFKAWVKDMQNAGEPKPTSDLAQQGQEIFNQKCLSCHAVSPADGRPESARLAPNLATFGERNRIAGILEHNEEELKNWLTDPEQYKPGNKMTGTYGELSEEEKDALAEYLMGLKVQD